jgi:hypothetical protein
LNRLALLSVFLLQRFHFLLMALLQFVPLRRWNGLPLLLMLRLERLPLLRVSGLQVGAFLRMTSGELFRSRGRLTD